MKPAGRKWIGPSASSAPSSPGPSSRTRLAGFGGAARGPAARAGWAAIDNLTNFFLPMLGELPMGTAECDPTPCSPRRRRGETSSTSRAATSGSSGSAGSRSSCASCWFLRNGFRVTRSRHRRRADDIGVAAVATRAALWCLLIPQHHRHAPHAARRRRPLLLPPRAERQPERARPTSMTRRTRRNSSSYRLGGVVTRRR